MMGNSRDVMLKLVRMAMGWETDFSLPDDVNWSEVLDLAHDQGVAAVILDVSITASRIKRIKSSQLFCVRTS